MPEPLTFECQRCTVTCTGPENKLNPVFREIHTFLDCITQAGRIMDPSCTAINYDPVVWNGCIITPEPDHPRFHVDARTFTFERTSPGVIFEWVVTKKGKMCGI